MTQKHKPAPHQKRALASLDVWWDSRADSKRHGYLVMPTGSGKTFTATTFATKRVLSGRAPCVLWVAHNDFLLEQARAAFERAIDAAGMNGEVSVARVSGDGRGADANVMLASIQMLERGEGLKLMRAEGIIDLAVIDEFHHVASDNWKKVIQRLQRGRGTRVLGLSATPFRTNQRQNNVLRGLFPHRVHAIGLTELVRSGFLAKPSVQRVKFRSGKKLKLSAEELRNFNAFHRLPASVLDRIASQSGRDAAIVKMYADKRDSWKKTIVFCCSVEHAERLAALFRRQQIQAASICGSAKDVVNREQLEAFRSGELEVATTVILLTEGVDVPSCRSVFLARPTESPILLQQMIGRAMRGQGAGGGATCNVVDFVDNFERGLDFSATSLASLRDHEVSTERFLRREMRKEQHGIDVALLLRLREFMCHRLAEEAEDLDLSELLVSEVVGWLTHWDGYMQRVLLLPVGKTSEIMDAVFAVQKKARANVKAGPSLRDEATALARAMYHDRSLEEARVPEEDFVNIAAAVAAEGVDGNQTEWSFHLLNNGEDAIASTPQLKREAGAAVISLERDLEQEPELKSDLSPQLQALKKALGLLHRVGEEETVSPKRRERRSPLLTLLTAAPPRGEE